jgi:hypothetical protein
VTTLSAEIDGHTASAQVMGEWIYWKLNPPLPGFIPCREIWMMDPGPELRIERLTAHIQKSKAQGDGPSIAATNNLLRTLGMAEIPA